MAVDVGRRDVPDQRRTVDGTEQYGVSQRAGPYEFTIECK